MKQRKQKPKPLAVPLPEPVITPEDERQFMTVKDIAALFQRTEITVYKWIEEGMFRTARKVRLSWLISRAEVIRIYYSGTVSLHK